MMRNVGRAQRVSSAPTPALLVSGEAQHVSGPRALLSLSREYTNSGELRRSWQAIS